MTDGLIIIVVEETEESLTTATKVMVEEVVLEAEVMAVLPMGIMVALTLAQDWMMKGMS